MTRRSDGISSSSVGKDGRTPRFTASRAKTTFRTGSGGIGTEPVFGEMFRVPPAAHCEAPEAAFHLITDLVRYATVMIIAAEAGLSSAPPASPRLSGTGSQDLRS